MCALPIGSGSLPRPCWPTMVKSPTNRTSPDAPDQKTPLHYGICACKAACAQALSYWATALGFVAGLPGVPAYLVGAKLWKSSAKTTPPESVSTQEALAMETLKHLMFRLLYVEGFRIG